MSSTATRCGTGTSLKSKSRSEIEQAFLKSANFLEIEKSVEKRPDFLKSEKSVRKAKSPRRKPKTPHNPKNTPNHDRISNPTPQPTRTNATHRQHTPVPTIRAADCARGVTTRRIEVALSQPNQNDDGGLVEEGTNKRPCRCVSRPDEQTTTHSHPQTEQSTKTSRE